MSGAEWPFVLLLLCAGLALCLHPGAGQASCGPASGPAADIPAFLQIGEFSVRRVSDSRTELRDSAGRWLTLVPHDAPLPLDCDPRLVLRVPAKRVVAYGHFTVGALRALGVANEVLVGVTVPESEWAGCSADLAQAMQEGRITWLGDAPRADYERLKRLEPDLVLTWDVASLPLLEDLRIPAVVIASSRFNTLETRMRFAQFLAPLFGKEREAAAWFARVNRTLAGIRARVAAVQERPKVMWGETHGGKRVIVEPGNSWIGELVELARGDYLFKDVLGPRACCLEISLERFLHSGKDADLYFTYQGRSAGVTSKAALARMNPLIRDIRPLTQGRVYAPTPCYKQSMDRLDDLLTEIAAILHPALYPDRQLRYFEELPDREIPETAALPQDRTAGGQP